MNDLNDNGNSSMAGYVLELIDFIEGEEFNPALILLWHELFYKRESFSEQKYRYIKYRDQYREENKIWKEYFAAEKQFVLKELFIHNFSQPLALLNALDCHAYHYVGSRSCGIFDDSTRKINGLEFTIFTRCLRGYDSNHATQPCSEIEFMYFHHIIPRIIDEVEIEIKYKKLKDKKVDKSILNFAATSFEDNVMPQWQETDHYRTTEKLTDFEARKTAIEVKLSDAMDKGINILVMPELTVCPELRVFVSDWLKKNKKVHQFLLVLPGSFHIKEDNREYNYGQLLDHSGAKVLEHYKMRAFAGKDGRTELIMQRSKIQLLKTPYGTFAMPICLDYCDERSNITNPQFPWQKLNIDYFLVPSMDHSNSPHLRQARILYRSNRSISVVAIQKLKEEQNVKSFIYCGVGGDEQSDGEKSNENKGEFIERDLPVYPCKVEFPAYWV